MISKVRMLARFSDKDISITMLSSLRCHRTKVFLCNKTCTLLQRLKIANCAASRTRGGTPVRGTRIRKQWVDRRRTDLVGHWRGLSDH
jgi:hypothetical protein